MYDFDVLFRYFSISPFSATLNFHCIWFWKQTLYFVLYCIYLGNLSLAHQLLCRWLKIVAERIYPYFNIMIPGTKWLNSSTFRVGEF